MIALYEQIRRIAPSSAPAFITGESGTGKEVCAAEIHRQSGRPAEKFVAINCAAIPHELMESELFGHVRGAFTGAGEDRPGAMQLADGGTLFLDEICEMDLALQAKLLRALQMKSVRRVGASADESVDVRIVCATNRDPQAEVNARRFRADLFYRLHVLPLHLPPLRERGDDIMKLANAFLKRYSAEENRGFTGFSPQARQFLQSYDWPGNVRQLENLVRRIVVMHDGETVEADMIPLALAHAASPPSSAPAANANDPGPPARGARTGGNGVARLARKRWSRRPEPDRTVLDAGKADHRERAGGMRRPCRPGRGGAGHQRLDDLPQEDELGRERGSQRLTFARPAPSEGGRFFPFGNLPAGYFPKPSPLTVRTRELTSPPAVSTHHARVLISLFNTALYCFDSSRGDVSHALPSLA